MFKNQETESIIRWISDNPNIREDLKEITNGTLLLSEGADDTKQVLARIIRSEIVSQNREQLRSGKLFYDLIQLGLEKVDWLGIADILVQDDSQSDQRLQSN